jgi:hypothetical protein
MPHAAVRRARAAVLAALCCAAGAAEPPAREEHSRAVRVSVVAILATDKNDKVDPRLVDVANAVKFNVDPNLTGYRVAHWCRKSLKPGACDSFPLGCDQTVAVTIMHGPDAQERVQLKVSPPLLGEVTYSAACGAFLPIVTRHRTKNGELLIIAVRVAPCPGK